MADVVTSSDDLVVRLQAAIERVERAANEAKTGSGRWVSGPRLNHPGYEIAELQTGWVHTQTQRSEQSHHMAVNDPESVLRLCQSHRDILEEWRKQAQIRDQLAVEAEGCADHMAAVCITAGLWAAVTLVARGYGIEVQT